MPIYAYKCESCGHRQDVLQKISDPVLSTCPACQAATFKKQVTAAGFQLKGSGWYATDFRNGSSAAPPAASSGKSEGAASGDAAKSEGSKDGNSNSSASATPDSKASATSSAAASCGNNCACH